MKILNYPHPALRNKCQPLTGVDESVRTAAAKMLELMYRAEGLGLAAPQVGLDYQMLVLNLEADPERKDLEIVALNPVIVESKGAVKDREGCLSFPGLFQDIRRYKTVTVQYYTLDGELREMKCSDLAARLWQHEVDHLEGTLFIDKMGTIARMGSKKDIDIFLDDFRRAIRKGDLPPDIEMKL
jgi:peptide deformylase